ncbi:hypothetical protein M5K25_008550 [Dendrobium thyrsiflorum]|uniref:3-beta hydroxysteroid dehydrogenase/isomerase domain-containing protein n=1 Tax=Dendrobium thyrsiflorum TaxID=117978 RepID=A0ABD0V8Y7_DENTH
MEKETKGPVVVTGAGGYVGSWLVMKLLQKGYEVRATVRDPTNLKKVKPLLDLPRSKELLSIWKADLNDVEGSLDEVIRGSIGVFHVATPMNFQSKDPENEVIQPAINGLLGILRSCKNAGSVQRVIFTSSAGTVNIEEHQAASYDESCWSDLDFVNRVKMTGWQVQFVHLDDLCDAHIFLFEHPKANGRYICSSYDSTIYDLAEMLKNRYPTYDIPQKFKDIDPDIKCVSFSSKKLMELGFKYKYTLEEMFDDAIKTCREKKLIPLKIEEIVLDAEKLPLNTEEIVLAAEKFEENKEHIAVKFKDIDPSKKFMELGFNYKYTMEEMFDDAINTYREKKLIPLNTEEIVLAAEKIEENNEQIADTSNTNNTHLLYKHISQLSQSEGYIKMLLAPSQPQNDFHSTLARSPDYTRMILAYSHLNGAIPNHLSTDIDGIHKLTELALLNRHSNWHQ